ncbi:MAG: hypothetical protein JST76_14160 [Bacteroidetes bacterium]|nr:hypothetical protein [Bacteroidota bacterium]
MAWLISSVMGETSDEHSEHIFSGLALIISGILVQRFTRNYYISPDGSKVYFEQEGYFMHVGVSFWHRVFIGLGLIFIAGTLADKYLL